MKQNIFRKTSIERVNSPEQLNEYVRVVSPSVWLTLIAIVILLVGVLIWGIFGKIETKVDTCVVAEKGKLICYLSVKDAEQIKAGMDINIEGHKGKIKSVSEFPIQVDESIDDYALFIGGFSKDDFCYTAEIEADDITEDGTYDADIRVDNISPISFIIK